MGIRGLTGFVNDRQRFLLKRSKVVDQYLIVDGKALLHFLYHENSLDVRFGGSYMQFRQIVEEFLKRLQTCKIKPIVVFDGGCSKHKQNTKLSRQQDNVQLACNIIQSHSKEEAQCNRLLPPMTGLVLCQTLSDLKIPFVYSDTDADRDIVALANLLGASVLSNDSDFYVLDVIHGYLPLSHFNWKEVFHDETQGQYMHGLRYHRKALLSTYKLDRAMPAFLSILLGSDWLPRDTFSVFLSQITQSGPSSKKCGELLSWLSKQKDTEVVVEKIMRRIANSQREAGLERVRWCLSFYNTLPKNEKLLQRVKEQCDTPMHLNTAFKEGTTDAGWHNNEQCDGKGHTRSSELNELIAKEDLPTFVASVVTNNGKVPLPVFLSKPYKPSAHAQCTKARRALYRMLQIRNILQNDVTVVEFDRVGVDYHQSAVLKSTDLRLSPCPCYAITSSFDDVTDEWRRQYLLESLLGCKTESLELHVAFGHTINNLRKIDEKFSARFEVMWMSTVAWMRAGLPLALAISLILVLVYGVLENANSSDLLLSALDANDSDDFSHVDTLSQWQCWMQIAIALNCLLGFPMCRTTFGVFDCSSVAAIYNQVNSWRRNRLISEVDRRLALLPRTRKIVQLLIGAIEQQM
uniref:Protein asteroid homolog 1 n=1 Tax=Phallusia mammillata TaxID=59560 RepID=A0A6F9D7J4_9ASCI|nr:protein asteroid homolog 1 [Phallusia mammillata]